MQGHSGGNLVDPALQDNVLLPDDFVEYIYHIGNANELHSTIQSRLIPEGRSLRKDRQCVFFTEVNLMDDNQDLEEVQIRSGQTQNRSVQKYLECSTKIHYIGAI